MESRVKVGLSEAAEDQRTLFLEYTPLISVYLIPHTSRRLVLSPSQVLNASGLAPCTHLGSSSTHLHRGREESGYLAPSIPTCSSSPFGRGQEPEIKKEEPKFPASRGLNR